MKSLEANVFGHSLQKMLELSGNGCRASVFLDFTTVF